MRSLWLQEALGGAEEDAPRLEGDEKADVRVDAPLGRVLPELAGRLSR